MSVFKTGVVCLLALLVANTAAVTLHADSLIASYWAEGSTDPSGNYNPTGPISTQAGAYVVGAIPTDATSSDGDLINYFRTLSALPGATAAYDGFLLGDLSGYTGLTATFNLDDSAVAPGATFQTSELVGEMNSNFGIRLMFMGGYLADGTPNEWWSNPTVAWATSMQNGQNATLTVAFDPSLWSNYYGHVGTESTDTETQFAQALAGVTRLGLSFGSGYFFSDGFAFNTGGSAQIELEAIAPTLANGEVAGAAATPEPGYAGVLAGALCLLGVTRRRARG